MSLEDLAKQLQGEMNLERIRNTVAEFAAKEVERATLDNLLVVGEHIKEKDALKDQLATLQKQCESWQQQHTEQACEGETLRDTLTRLRKAADDWQKQYEELRRDLAQRTAELNLLRKYPSNIGDGLPEIVDFVEMEKIEKERDSLRTRFDSLNKCLTAALNLANGITSEDGHSPLYRAINELRTRADEQRIKIMELDRAVDTMHRRAEDAEARATRAEAEVEELRGTPAASSADSLIAAIEGNLHGMCHGDLVLTCEMLERGRAAWRKEAEEAQAQLTLLQQDVRPLVSILRTVGELLVDYNRQNLTEPALATFLAKHPTL